MTTSPSPRAPEHSMAAPVDPYCLCRLAGLRVVWGKYGLPLRLRSKTVQRSSCRGHVHMGESKPPVPSSQFALRSAFARASEDVDPYLRMVRRTRRRPTPQHWSGSTQLGRDDRTDQSLIAVCYRNGTKIRDGVLIARRARRIAGFDQVSPSGRASRSSGRAFRMIDAWQGRISRHPHSGIFDPTGA